MNRHLKSFIYLKKAMFLGVVVLAVLIAGCEIKSGNVNLNALLKNSNFGTETSTDNLEPVIENKNENVVEYPNYPWHRNITATVFWVGEPVGDGSSEDNASSCWDDSWQQHFGGYDDPFCRQGFYPCGLSPKDQNFYVTVPYNDFDDEGNRKGNVNDVVPWAQTQIWSGKSLMKGQWVEVTRGEFTCYAQVNDCGPYEYDDWEYVFGKNERQNSPKNQLANNAGMDVSPALRDCLHFEGLNNDENKINWRFVSEAAVPAGPWKEFITTSAVFWE